MNEQYRFLVPTGENNNMKCIPKLSVLALTVGMLLSGAANADLIINDGASPSPVVNSQPSTGLLTSTINTDSSNSTASVVTPSASLISVTQTGTAVPSAPLRGWANNIDLMTALKQVVPNGWKAKKLGSIDMNKKVSWQGGKSWVDILSNLALQGNFTANVNWNTQEVTISGKAGSVTTSTTTTTTVSSDSARNPFSGASSVNSSRTTTKIGSSSLSSVISTQPIASSYKETWVLSKNKTLKENLEDWATKAGWTLSWDAPDYRIPADVTLSGSLADADGPIAQIVKAYEDAQQPLTAKLSKGNRVIRIESRNYHQETVVGQSMNDTFTNLSTR